VPNLSITIRHFFIAVPQSTRRQNVRLAAENAKLRQEQHVAALRAEVEKEKTKVGACVS
jgi:hypothetical protein